MLLGLKVRNYNIYKVEQDIPSGKITETNITPKGQYKYIDKLNGFTITANSIATAKRYFKKVYAHYGLFYMEQYIKRVVKKTNKCYGE
jgi:hypothetical protein